METNLVTVLTQLMERKGGASIGDLMPYVNALILIIVGVWVKIRADKTDKKTDAVLVESKSTTQKVIEVTAVAQTAVDTAQEAVDVSKDTHVVAQKTEKLVNSQSGMIKRALAVSTALNQKLQPSPENEKLASDAAKAVEEHDANQARADAVPPAPPAVAPAAFVPTVLPAAD